MPRIFRRILSSGSSIHQRIHNHAGHVSRTNFQRIHFPILIPPKHRRIGVTINNVAKIDINAVVIRFTGPVHDERRNLERRTNAKDARIFRRVARHVAALRIRINPDRIVASHQGIQRNQRIDIVVFTDVSLASITFHPEALLKINLPFICMLIDRSRVPTASIRKRPHLDDIARRFHDHRRGHVLPRAFQTHHLRFRRVENDI